MSQPKRKPTTSHGTRRNRRNLQTVIPNFDANVRSGSGIFSQTMTGDVTSEMSPGIDAKTPLQEATRPKKVLASHRGTHGTAVGQFIKNHSLGHRNSTTNQTTELTTARFSAKTAANTFRDGKRSVSIAGEKNAPKTLVLRKYSNIDFY